jgi:hypothetical protein
VSLWRAGSSPATRTIFRLVTLILHSTVANGDDRCGVRLAQDPLIQEPGSGFEVPKLYCSISVTSLIVAFAYYINSLIQLRIQKQKEKYMKTITTIAAIAALTTLAACGTAEAPAEVTATEAAATEAAPAEAAPAEAAPAVAAPKAEPGTQPK